MFQVLVQMAQIQPHRRVGHQRHTRTGGLGQGDNEQGSEAGQEHTQARNKWNQGFRQPSID